MLVCQLTRVGRRGCINVTNVAEVSALAVVAIVVRPIFILLLHPLRQPSRVGPWLLRLLCLLPWLRLVLVIVKCQINQLILAAAAALVWVHWAASSWQCCAHASRCCPATKQRRRTTTKQRWPQAAKQPLQPLPAQQSAPPCPCRCCCCRLLPLRLLSFLQAFICLQAMRGGTDISVGSTTAAVACCGSKHSQALK